MVRSMVLGVMMGGADVLDRIELFERHFDVYVSIRVGLVACRGWLDTAGAAVGVVRSRDVELLFFEHSGRRGGVLAEKVGTFNRSIGVMSLVGTYSFLVDGIELRNFLNRSSKAWPIVVMTLLASPLLHSNT